WRSRMAIEPESHFALGESMSLKDKITSDMTAAMKAQDRARTSTLRMLKAAIVDREKDTGQHLDEEEVTKLLRSQLQQRRDSAEHFQKGNRPDLVDKETAEIAVIESYLPQPRSEERRVGKECGSRVAACWKTISSGMYRRM